MSILLFTIATGEAYRKYAIDMFASAHEFWPEADTLAFTDLPQHLQAHVRCIHTQPKGFPDETLYRYHTVLRSEHILRQWDNIFYADSDMRFVAPVGDVLSDGITATLHPGFAVERMGRNGDYIRTFGTPERGNQSSTAYIPPTANNKYFCGGFNGGKTDAYLAMAKVISRNIDRDKENFGMGYSAIWHDESHLNRYLFDHPPAKILTPSYCYPEDYTGFYGWPATEYEPILLALDKRKKR